MPRVVEGSRTGDRQGQEVPSDTPDTPGARGTGTGPVSPGHVSTDHVSPGRVDPDPVGPGSVDPDPVAPVPVSTGRADAGGEAGGVAAYRAILREGRAVRPFAASVVARLPISMAPIGMVLLVQQVRGSYGPAGLVTGAFALGTAGGAPVWGRAMDRIGQPRVIAGTACTSAALLAALALGAVHGAGDGVLVALAFLAGLVFPAMSPAMRAAWRVVVPDPRRRRGGYALDAVAVESIFVGGPLLLSLLLAVTAPQVPLLLTAGLLATGGVTYSRTAAARGVPAHRLPPPRDGTGQRRRPVFATAGILPALIAMLAMAIGFGQIDTSIAATARTVFGDNSVLGFLFAAIAGGSVVGGLTYGAVTGRRGEAHRLPVTMGLFAIMLVPLTILLSHGRPSLWLLEPLLFLAGLAIAPTIIIMANLVDAHSPAGQANESQAWLGTATTAGAATGTALAGVLIDSGGVGRSLTGALIAVAVGALCALGGQRSWRRTAR